MADLDPNKKRVAQLCRMLGSSGGERRNAFAALEKSMQSGGLTWSDIGNAIERGFGCDDDGKYTEAELQEFGQALRAEGVEAGIQIGLARAGNGSSSGNGHLTLPKPVEIAEYCHQRAGQLKDDKQRDFVRDMRRGTVLGHKLTKGQLGYLVSIYIQIGGRT